MFKKKRGTNHAQRARQLAETGDSKAAISAFRRAIQLSPMQPPWVFAHLGNLLLEVERFEEAEALFAKLVHDRPALHEGHLGLASVAHARGQWELSAERWTACIAGYPEQVDAYWYSRVAAAQLELQRFEDAKATNIKLIAAFPDQLDGYVGLALAAHRGGAWDDSLTHWNTCFEKFPAQAQSWWETKRQQALSRSGRHDEARQAVRESHHSDTAQAYFRILQEKGDGSTSPRLNFQSVLVITYGRSGSTLLQGILNIIDGMLVRGENENVFRDCFRIHKKLGNLKAEYGGVLLPNKPWYGIGLFDETRLLAHFREFARTLLLADHLDDPGITCYGFKEIRYDEMGDELFEYLDFLADVFPNPAFVFNTRNLDDVIKSAWWKERDSSEVKAELGALETQFDRYAREHSNCFQITYEAIRSQDPRLSELFRFLGADYDSDKIKAVLSTPHSYQPAQKDVDKLFREF